MSFNQIKNLNSAACASLQRLVVCFGRGSKGLVCLFCQEFSFTNSSRKTVPLSHTAHSAQVYDNYEAIDKVQL